MRADYTNAAHSERLLTGLALLRIYVAAIFVIHGAQKLFVLGPSATANFFSGAGIPAPTLSAGLVIFAEFFCGLALLVGFLTRLAAIPLAIDMLGAIVFVHARHGFFMQNGGFEYPLLLLIGSLSLMMAGGGALALDNVLSSRGRREERPELRKVA